MTTSAGGAGLFINPPGRSQAAYIVAFMRLVPAPSTPRTGGAKAQLGVKPVLNLPGAVAMASSSFTKAASEATSRQAL